MKERGILFSAPMVRALLAGTKTQTRRALKIQPLDILPMQGENTGREWVGLTTRDPEPKGVVVRCRLGVPGDRLWVREAWTTHAFLYDTPPRDLTTRSIAYVADGPIQTGKYRPGMFMPRWASRITLEITEVRVQRLQDISEADAIAEGIEKSHIDAAGRQQWKMYPHTDGDPKNEVVVYCGKAYTLHPIESYRSLWLSINGPGSWDANPWVWVVCFRNVKDPAP